MTPTSDPIRAHVIVFGGFEGARYRAGRTVRLLQRRFERVTDATMQTGMSAPPEMPIWLVRAGAMPRDLSNWFVPAPNGKPLCAFGITWAYAPGATARCNVNLCESLQNELAGVARESAQWLALQSQTGGDFAVLNDFHGQCPPVASALLDQRLGAPLAESLAAGHSIDAALRDVLTKTSARCVRLPHLDVFDDPALRVAQVVTSIQRGGAERVTLDLVRELPHWRVRPRLFVLGSPTRAMFSTPPECEAFPPGKNRAEHVRNFAECAVELGCDVVHAHLLNAADLRLVAESGLPVVATVHNAPQGWPADFAQGVSLSPLGGEGLGVREGEGPALLAACAQSVERDLIDAQMKDPIRTVWNGIDWGEYQPFPERAAEARALRAKLELSPHDFVLLSLANPRSQKRLQRLPAVLAALRELMQQRGSPREAKLIVAGEASRGNEDAARCEAELRAEIARLGLDDHVRMIGAAEHIAPTLFACDALISVSAWEGLSLAHLEALAAGRRVVATAAGGTAEIARDFPALTVVPLDASPAMIAEKLAETEEPCWSAGFQPAGFNVANGNQVEPQIAKDRLAARQRNSFALHTMASRYASLYPRVIEAANMHRRRLAGRDAGGTGIWLIANNFTTGGAQSSSRRLLLGMQARGIRARAAVLQESEENPTPGLRALRERGVAVFVAQPRSTDPLVAVQQILERIDGDRPQAILFWNVIAEHKILLADALWNIPIYDVSPGEMCFDSLEQYFARPRPGLPYRSGADYGARLAGAVVKYHREAIRAESFLKTAVQVIPNGLPLDEWDANLAPAPSTRIVIGTSARISPQKKLEELLGALRLAAPELPPHVLRIAGRAEHDTEEYFARLKALSADLSVEWVEEFQDSKQFLAGLDIFAMISEPAGCPNASLEAMASGLPLIATDHGGASEQVEDGVTGLLVPRGDADAFAQALIELARDPAKRRAFGLAGRARAEQRFSLERMVGDYVRLCLGA